MGSYKNTETKTAWNLIEGEGGAMEALYNLEAILVCCRMSIEHLLDDDGIDHATMWNVAHLLEMGESELKEATGRLEDSLREIKVKTAAAEEPTLNK